MISYKEAEDYISDIPKFAGKNTVQDTGRLLLALTGNEWKSKVIHVAGTNGKGSVCAYLRSVLLESGRSVGMFISPHLETMRERISVNGEMISEQDFAACFEHVMERVEEGKKEGLSHPSFFEYLFLWKPGLGAG